MTLVKQSPLQALIGRAAALPKDPGALARYEAKVEAAASGSVVVADVSSSMAESAGGRTKIAILREAMLTAPPARVVAFSCLPVEVASPGLLPEPSGSTALHLALDLVAGMCPRRTLVVSDGEPDSEERALEAAALVPGVIDVIYIGRDDNHRAKAFLLSLTRAGRGRYTEHDIRFRWAALAPAIRHALLPESAR